MKIKRILYLSATAVQVLGLAGVFAVQYFTGKKMGMARYVVYKNRGWEANYPMELLVSMTALFLVLLAAAVLLFFLKHRRRANKTIWLMNAGMLLFTVLCVGFICVNSAAGLRTYYFIGAILALVSLLQTIKTFVGILMCKHEE